MSLEYPFIFPLKNGLHARPAEVLRDAADRFRCFVSLHNGRNGRPANAKSVLSLVSADFRLDDPVTLVTEGDDERAAMSALQKFLREEFPGCDEPLPEARPPVGERFVPRLVAGSGAEIHRGTPVSSGLALAPAVVADALELPSGFPETAADSTAECAALTKAVEAVSADIEARLKEGKNTTEREVLRAHLAVAQDPELAEKTRSIICEEGRSAPAAVLEMARVYSELLLASESQYLRERVLDIRDVGGQLLRKLCGAAAVPVSVRLTAPSVVAAELLTPSELLALDRRYLAGLVLSEGGTTSHTVILARAFGVPCVTGVRDIHRAVRPGHPVVLDARRGLVIPDPPETARRYYELELRREALRRERAEPFLGKIAMTGDGRRIEVGANVSTAAEAEAAFARGAEGIGLFRTEMLFLDRTSPPGEEEQYAEYRRAVAASGGRPVTFRTLDIGGDKPLAYLYFPKEDNPFLGYRSPRFYPAQALLVRAQLRAILRAAAGGNVKVMFPMISQVAEVRALKAMLREAARELEAEGVEHNPAVEVGMMMEVPAAAFAIEQLAREVAFFSIGTNDLAQYFFAADRGNQAVAELSNPLHPAFLRFLRRIVDDAHAAKRWVGMCGEMAGREKLAPLLLGLRLDAISMAPPAIPNMKAAIHDLHSAECDSLLAGAMAKAETAEVKALLHAQAGARIPAGLLHADFVVLDSDVRTRGEAVKELVDRLALAGRTSDPDALEETVWRQEELCPSAAGCAFAVPNGLSPGVTAASLAVLRLREPVDWRAADGQPVRLVFLLAGREADGPDAQAELISRLTHRIAEPGFRERLLSAPAADAVIRCIQEALEL